MPQLQLPIFPEGMTMLNANLGVMTRDGTVTYIYGSLPIFTHAVDDLKTFRMIARSPPPSKPFHVFSVINLAQQICF